MAAPIEDVGGAQGVSQSPNTSNLGAVNAGGNQQLAQLMRTVVDEFAAYSSPDLAAQMLNTIRQMVDAGLPVKDVVDAMYASPGALDALRDGDTARAAGSVAAWMTTSLNELRDSGVPEDRMRYLNQQGFAVGEIAVAMRVVPGLREELARGDFANPRQAAQAMNDYFRSNGRATHNDPSVLAGAERQPAALNAPGTVWSEQYLKMIRSAQRRFNQYGYSDAARYSSSRPDEEDEVNLVFPVLPPPVEQPSSYFGMWMVAVIVAVALFVLVIGSRC
jgi:hypothetical protein